MKEGYYRQEVGRVGRHKQTKATAAQRAWRVVDGVMIVITAMAAVALVAALLAGVVDPRSASIFAFAGLFYPIIWLINLFCAFWWAARWRRYFVVPMVMLLVGGGKMGLFYRSDLSTKPDDVDRDKNDIVLLSYNVMNFNDIYTAEDDEVFVEVADYINQQSPTIVALQEAHFSETDSFERFRSMVKRLPYGYFVNSEVKKDTPTGSGYVLLSAYPIVRKGAALKDSVQVYSIWADLRIGRDTVRVFNNHLQSTGITSDEREGVLSRQIVGDSLAHKKLTKLADKIKKNYQKRAEQVDCVVEQIEQSPYPVVVCGDFNDTPQSYVYRRMVRCGLADAYVECGKGIEHTFRELYKLFRIDYVMADKESLVVKEYSSADHTLSDHKALNVRISKLE